MKYTFFRIILISFLLVLLIPNLTFAETKTFIKEYTYQASDEDSKNSSRTISLREVKRLLLEELGIYLESRTEIKNSQLTKDQIITFTAGIVQTELVDEKWDGRTYWLKAKITADSSEVIKAIDSLRKDRDKTKELEEVRKRSDELLKENERLRKELATATGEKKQKDTDAYNKTIEGLDAIKWFEIGYQADISNRWQEAISAFTKAIDLNPKYAAAYINRGFAYTNLGNNNQAINDLDTAIELNPQLAAAYLNRGKAYYDLASYKQALNDYNKAIELNPKYAKAYLNRGNAYHVLGNNKQAIADFDKAIELNPKFAAAYNDRGAAYAKLGNYKQAINDYNKAIDLDPQLALAYYNRAIRYDNLGNKKQAIEDLKIAARLGLKKAQDVLTKHGITW